MTDAEYLKRKFRKDVTDAGTGLSLEELKAEAAKIVAEYEDREPWVTVKARMFEMICDRMAIGVSEHDMFPAVACWSRKDRPLAGIIKARMKRVDAKMCPEADKAAGAWWSSGKGVLRHDFDHAAPDWDTAIRLGFPGLRARLDTSSAKNEWMDAFRTAADAILRCVRRLAAHARARGAAEMADALAALAERAPRTTYETLLFQFLYFIFGEHVDMMQVRTLGGLDRLLLPFYRADLLAGRIDEARMRELLRHFWWQWGSIDNWWGQPVYIGPAYNELSKIILEVHDELALPTPKLQLQLDGSAPDWVWLKSLDMVRRHRSLVFCGVEPMRAALRTIGFAEDEIREIDLWGCYEFQPRATANSTIPSVMNLASPAADLLAAAKRGEFSAADYAAFEKAYLDEVRRRSDLAAKTVSELEAVTDEFIPSLVHSLTIASCVEKGRNAISNGMKHNTSLMLQTGLANAVDSLLAVKEMVYERGDLSLKELGVLMAANWTGREDLRLRMFRSRRKWGAGSPEADALGRRIMHAFAEPFRGRVNSRGGRFVPGGHSIDYFRILRGLVSATPDGRRRGEEFGKNLSPAPGADREGATAVVNSIGALDKADVAGDIIVDMMLLPVTVEGDRGLAAMKTLVKGYFAKGGCAINFNVIDPAEYRDAQLHPEKYENLQVRLCGWNVRWNDLPKAEQDAYLLRADNLQP